MFTPSGPTSRLSTGEITECLQRAFNSLPQEQQDKINFKIAPLLEIPRMGPTSALHLFFAVYRADDLARLNQALREGE